MMCGFRTLVLLMVPALGAALMTGCASEPVKTPPPPAPVIIPASSDQAMNITLDVTKLDPSAKVGSVKAVNSSAGMVAVGGIPLDAVKKGDSIQFVDGRSNCVANGTIITIDKSTDPAVPYLIVDYTPASGGRAPIKGDLAVFIASKCPSSCKTGMESPRLILASASPRRRELLMQAGYEFEVHPADIDEDDYPPQTLPADLALRLSMLKAQALVPRFGQDVILAADTVVAFGDIPLGKPEDEDDAVKMLELLSGTTHVVITGVTALRPATNFSISTKVMSAVRMRPWSQKEIHRYVASGDWKGKAGGYGIQDERPDPFVTRLAGSHSNIVGLPMEATSELLSSAGILPRDGGQKPGFVIPVHKQSIAI